jgi:serine/threonine-protein kinase HipA
MRKIFNITLERNIVGILSVYNSDAKEYYSFEYSADWLAGKNSFAIDPNLPLVLGTASVKKLWGAFQDVSPDRWGKILQDRAGGGKFLSDADYMLGVSDYMRLGALRISAQKEPHKYLAEHHEIPKLSSLRVLEDAIINFEEHKITDDELNILLEPGSSLGGARPKAVIEDEGKLYIAKFSSKNDAYRLISWEAVSLELAKIAGINIPFFKLLNKDSQKPVLLVERFDRNKERRIHFMSAMAMLSQENSSYLDLADIIRVNSANFKRDLLEMWKRMTFNALFANTDDHLRNHAFVKMADGWHLSPAYDLNPTPINYSKQNHSISFDGMTILPSLDLCADLAEYFGLGKDDINRELKNIGRACGQIDSVAKRYGLTKSEIDFMSKFLKHKDYDKLI